MSRQIIKTKNFEIVKDENGQIRVFLNNKEVDLEGGDTLLLTENETYHVSLEEIYFLPFSYHIIDDSRGILTSEDNIIFESHIAFKLKCSLEKVKVSFLISGDREDIYPSRNEIPLNQKYLSIAADLIKKNPEFEVIQQLSIVAGPQNGVTITDSPSPSDKIISADGPIEFETEIHDVKSFGDLIEKMDRISRDLDNEVIQNLIPIN